MKLSFALVVLSALFTHSSPAEWEPAPFMDESPFGFDSTHTFALTLRGKVYAMTGNKRVREFDHCGDGCYTYEEYSDAYFSYDPASGWTDLGPHPGGERGYAQGDIMNRGTENEILYFGFGMRRYVDEFGNDLKWFPRWQFLEDGSYGINPNATSYPRLNDWWSFDGTTWKRLADFPGIGRTHPAVCALDNGKVLVGMGNGELCPTSEPCDIESPFEDPRGYSAGLRDAWLYDTVTDTWEEVAPLPYSSHHPYHFAEGGKAFFLAGHDEAYLFNNMYRYDLLVTGSDSWTEMAPIPGDGRVAGTQFAHKGKGYILGGEIAPGGNNAMEGYHDSYKFGLNSTAPKEHHRSMATDEFWEYDMSENTWKALPPTPGGRSRWAPASFVLDDYVYTFNGVIQEGEYRLGNFSAIWPQQGYRLYIGDDSKSSKAHKTTSAWWYWYLVTGNLLLSMLL